MEDINFRCLSSIIHREVENQVRITTVHAKCNAQYVCVRLFVILNQVCELRFGKGLQRMVLLTKVTFFLSF